jgi:hypothetical protein
MEFLSDGTYYLGSYLLDFGVAAVIPADNFNSYSNGDLTGNSGGSDWSAAWSGSTNYDVQGTTVYEGAKAIGNTSNSSGNISRTFSAVTSGVFSVAMRRSVNDTGLTRTLWEYTGDGTQYGVELAASGNILLKSASGDVTLQSYSADTWYVIELQVDTAVPRARARVDGGTWSSWASPFEGSGTGGVNKLYLDQDNATASNYWDTLE